MIKLYIIWFCFSNFLNLESLWIMCILYNHYYIIFQSSCLFLSDSLIWGDFTTSNLCRPRAVKLLEDFEYIIAHFQCSWGTSASSSRCSTAKEIYTDHIASHDHLNDTYKSYTQWRLDQAFIFLHGFWKPLGSPKLPEVASCRRFSANLTALKHLKLSDKRSQHIQIIQR